ncbi:MAG: hypothetical protein JSR41_12005 [Proteobacteria bacterium]|nr:hypothetical protein [Pseudomonadota bacterium]
MSTQSAPASCASRADASPSEPWPPVDLSQWLGMAALPALACAGQWFAFWAAWQRGCMRGQRELLDPWIARFGGGVPLDG